MKWFPHDTDALRNRKIRKVIRTHGVTGYGIWFALLEKLYEIEGDFTVTADELWLEDLAEDLKITDYRTLIRVFDTLAEVGLISAQLWEDHLIYCEAIAERGDAYVAKRAKEAEKKRKQRAKRSTMSPGDTQGTEGQNPKMSPTDPDLHTDLDLIEDRSILIDSEESLDEEGKGEKAGEPDISETQPPCPVGSESEDRSEDSGSDRSSGAIQISRKEFFTQFWASYPRKIAKPKAEKAFAKVPDEVLPEIVSIVEAQKAAYRRKHPTGWEYFPHPTTWLNGGRWGDVVEAPAPIAEGEDSDFLRWLASEWMPRLPGHGREQQTIYTARDWLERTPASRTLVARDAYANRRRDQESRPIAMPEEYVPDMEAIALAKKRAFGG